MDRADKLRAFFAQVPHNRALGMQLETLEPRTARMRMPWSPTLVGDPHTGILHNGAVTAMLDATCGAAATMAVPNLQAMATLDLRVDCVRPPTPHVDLVAEAIVEGLTEQLVYLRARAWHPEHEAQTVATATCTFMIGTARS